MRNSIILSLPAALLFLFSGSLRAQSQDHSLPPPNYQVDTRIDNMGYWRRCAELGLVPVQPMSRVAPAKYTGSQLIVDGILIGDSPDVPVTEQNSTQSENSTFVDPNNKMNALNSNNSSDNPNAGNFYGCDALTTFDGGESWGGSIMGAGGGNSGDPAACINMNGRYFVGLINNASGQSVAYSDNQGSSFTTVVVANAPSGYGNLLDKNHLWVDNSPTSPYQGNLYDAWTTFGGSNDSQIGISVSNTNGTSWSSVQHISQGVNAGSHNQGVNLKTGPDGEAYAAWAVYDSWPSDEKAIGFAKSLDGGVTWQTAFRAINNIRGIRTSGVPQNQRVNSFPSMACDISNGPDRGAIYIVWANIGVPGTNTGSDVDVYMIKSTDQGDTWSTPVRVNQDATGAGKKHYFPWITCDQANGMLSVVYYDNRNVNSNQTETYISYSNDGGNTWTDLKVSDVAMTPSPIPGLASGYMGDYLGISAYGGKTYPTWTDNRSGHALTYVSPIDLIIPAPNVIYDANFVNDTAFGNGDGTPNFGETELMGLKIKNTGTADADSVTVTISTGSPYVTIEDSTEFYGNIAQGASKTILNGFKFTIAPEIPNLTQIPFLCKSKDATDTVTISTFTVPAFAPAPTIISMTLNDISGNNNGQLDPGETVTVTFLTQNTGLYDAVDVVSTLTSSNPYVQVLTAPQSLGTLTPGQSANAVFTIHCDSTTYAGSAVVLHNVAQAQYQSDARDFPLHIEQNVEDWETGNFQKFPWQFGGDFSWGIDPNVKWEGNYSAGAGGFGNNQTAELFIQYNVMNDDSISFYRKTSTQPLGDWLKFYIDDLLVGNFSGNLDWRRYAYPVLAGPHTFRWVYQKDAAGTMNQDSVWVDYIVLPAEYKLALTAGPDGSVCGVQPYQLTAMAVNYDSLLWTTSGTGTFSDPTVYAPVYTPSDQDAANGAVTLTVTAWSMGADSTDQMVLTIVPATTAQAGSDGQVCSNGTYTASGASATNYGSLLWATSGDGTFDDPTLLSPVYTPGSQDAANGTVQLMLTANGTGTCPPITDTLTLDVLAAPAVNLGPDTTVCSYLVYTLDATTPGAASYLWTPGGMTTPTVQVDSTGVGVGIKQVSVVVTDQNGCQATDAVNITFKDCMGIRELQGVDVNLYPNPASGLVNVELRTDHPQDIYFQVFSTGGKLVFRTEPKTVNGTVKERLDLRSLKQGAYLLEISNGAERLVRQLIIER